MRASRAGPGPSGNVVVTAGSITGTNVPNTLYYSAIPFIGLSTGSVAANGAISAITSLTTIYPKAFCYFPANILATSGQGSTAGFYYCTFSSATAGVAFLNSYTSGSAVAPASPTAVTNGQGAFTGDTGEEFGPTITIAANALGTMGVFDLWCAYTGSNTAGTKTLRVRYSGNAGTVYKANAVAPSTNNINSDWTMFGNAGATNAQIAAFPSNSSGLTAVGGTSVTSAVDTTAATTVVVSLQRNTATDNMVFIMGRGTLQSTGA